MRRLLLLLATFTAALLVLPGLPAMSTTPAATAEGAATASQAQVGVDGSATGTDPYWPKDGNGGTDAQHYDVRIGYDLASGRLRGRTAVTMTATEDLRSFSLDLLLAPTTVRVDGVKARFKKAGKHELRVKPKQPIATGSQFTVVVTYAGRPGARRYAGERAWLATKREVVAMGQPHMAPWWFPSNDHPSDKATFDVRVTMPKSQQVIGNGVRVKRKVKGSRATTHWRMSDPMATYLAFFAVGRFQIDKGTTAAGIPYYNAVSKAIKPQVRKYAATMLAKSGGITDWLQQRLGSYPFASTGGVVTSIDVGFALENQSRPTYGTWIYPSVIVHELAHQWFGDSVAVQRWRDIWLNEGFATYLEADYVAEHGGESVDAYLQRMWNRNCGTKNKDFWTLDLANPGADDIFDEAVYDRGAVTLAALRHRIGPEQMTTLLRTWVADHRGGNATVEQFIALAETVSGEDLDGFFQAWLSSGTTPAATPENGLAGITCA